MTYDNALEAHILNIIQNQQINEQRDLQEQLNLRGYKIPQATLSRRLKKLNIAKVAGFYKIIELAKPASILVLNMQISESGLIVLHTHPGNANNLALFIDQKYVAISPISPNSTKNFGILGTIAGDDTVLIITKNHQEAKKVLEILKAEFSYL